MLRDLVEHFSTLELTIANLPEDELGQGYEYLIKKFADDSGHTAAEFYTNRTVVHLMTEMLQPQPAESIYDPTCGSGGMLLSAITHLRRQNKEWRNVRLYGQERNLMTSSIARMNCFLHGIEDFRIERGDTLSEPKLVEADRLMRFDVVLANPLDQGIEHAVAIACEELHGRHFADNLHPVRSGMKPPNRAALGESESGLANGFE